jgi:hypothetical protein
MPYYAGIGSRETPPEINRVMTEAANFLYSHGYVLRSGGANGADSAFEAGVPDDTMKEIYLPWKNFNGNKSRLFEISEEALQLASQFHPAWDLLSYGVRKLIARNGYQVLGYDLNTPVSFVLCWTKGGKDIGGTAQAIKIAKSRGIPVFNLYFFEAREKIMSWITAQKITLEA